MKKPLNLLMVEDSDNDALLLVDELKNAGYELYFERVESEPEMVKALASPRPWDLVISDYSLPTFSATAALRIVKDKASDLPFIVMSGTIGEDRAAEILKAGASDFITKGMMQRLIPAVSRELREAQSRKERKRVERALEHAEMRFQSLCESAVDAIISTDGKGTILTCNQAAEKMFDLGRADMLGQPVEVFLPQARAEIGGERKIPGKILNMIGRRDNGTNFPVEVALTTWVSGAEPFYGAIIRDISERERLEGQLRQAQKMEAIGQLAGGIAHDFNNLLTVINGRSQLLIDMVKPGERVRRDLELIYKTGERAAALTRQLLAFSRKQILQPKPVDLNQITGEMDKLLQRLLPENISLATVLDRNLKAVVSDPSQIEQVILNLVVNARDAMPKGGKIVIETSNVELGEEYCRTRADVRPGHYVLLAVSDTGCGISPAVRARLFEPFFTTKGQGKGTGLGLSTVFGIVKQSGGTIDVYSEIDQGTVFKVYLPQGAEPAAKAKSSGENAAIPMGTEVILIVEDEDGVRDLVFDFLKANGYTVLIARHGKEALELCQKHTGPIHLLVTDVIMPELNGPELVDQIRPFRPDLKVLFASGYTDNAIVHNGLLQQGLHFIQKPFTPFSLARKVRQLLDNPKA